MLLEPRQQIEKLVAKYQNLTQRQRRDYNEANTNNVHYAEMGGYQVKELLNAIDRNIPVSQLQGYRTVEQYLKSPKEMVRLFQDLPEAIAV